MLHLRARIGGAPETQRSHHLAALGLIEQVERDHTRGYGSGYADEFTEAEVKKVHETRFLFDCAAADHRSKQRVIYWDVCRYPYVTSLISQRDMAQVLSILIKCSGVLFAGAGIERQFQMEPCFGIFQIQFPIPRRFAIFVRPNLRQDEFMAEIANILQRFFRNRRRLKSPR